MNCVSGIIEDSHRIPTLWANWSLFGNRKLFLNQFQTWQLFVTKLTATVHGSSINSKHGYCLLQNECVTYVMRQEFKQCHVRNHRNSGYSDWRPSDTASKSWT